MDNNFKDKTIIITGGSEGVGAAAARKFAAAGANLILVARQRKKLERLAEELRGVSRVEIVMMDVSDTDACVNLFKKAEFEFGGVHVLINNAGFHQRGLVETVDPEDLGRMIDVNLRAPIVLSRVAIPYLRQVDSAAIINVASLAGRAPIAGSAAYSASKFGLRAFTFALGEELADSNIKLAAVSPGPIDTGFIMSDIDAVADITFSQPMSTAEEVADQIMELCRNKKRERSMPPVSGFLATLSYLYPWINPLVVPLLEARGRQVKKALRSRIRAEEGEQNL